MNLFISALDPRHNRVFYCEKTVMLVPAEHALDKVQLPEHTNGVHPPVLIGEQPLVAQPPEPPGPAILQIPTQDAPVLPPVSSLSRKLNNCVVVIVVVVSLVDTLTTASPTGSTRMADANNSVVWVELRSLISGSLTGELHPTRIEHEIIADKIVSAIFEFIVLPKVCVHHQSSSPRLDPVTTSTQPPIIFLPRSARSAVCADFPQAVSRPRLNPSISLLNSQVGLTGNRVTLKNGFWPNSEIVGTNRHS